METSAHPSETLLGNLSPNTMVAWCRDTSSMQMERWLRFGLLASMVWVVVCGLLASRNETWIAAWKRHCSLAADATCGGSTIFLVVHGDAIAGTQLDTHRNPARPCSVWRCTDSAGSRLPAD
jgi:hypothetical protein